MFEKDTIKYVQYEEAIFKALCDRRAAAAAKKVGVMINKLRCLHVGCGSFFWALCDRRAAAKKVGLKIGVCGWGVILQILLHTSLHTLYHAHTHPCTHHIHPLLCSHTHARKHTYTHTHTTTGWHHGAHGGGGRQRPTSGCLNESLCTVAGVFVC